MENLINELNQKLDNSIEDMNSNLKKVRTSGATPSILDDVKVNYYDTLTPLNQVANIKAQDSTYLIVSPFDRTIVKEIVAAIAKSNLGLNASEDGQNLRIFVPPLTEEKRKEYVKVAKDYVEKAKIQVRNIRQDFNKKINSNEEYSDDQKKKMLNDVQNKINDINAKIDNILKEKSEQLLKI